MKLDEKKIVVSLIKDDLINTKLINGLNKLGMNADDYLINVSSTIFKILDIGDDRAGEDIFEWYMDSLKKVDPIDIRENHTALDSLALEIYLELLLEREIYRNR